MTIRRRTANPAFQVPLTHEQAGTKPKNRTPKRSDYDRWVPEAVRKLEKNKRPKND